MVPSAPLAAIPEAPLAGLAMDAPAHATPDAGPSAGPSAGPQVPPKVTPRATLVVCTTCRASRPEADTRPGADLMAALSTGPLPPGVTLRAVECLSACNTGCAVALQAPGKWSYIYGHLDPALHTADILQGAALYAASADGIVPWRDRPVIFRKQSLARVPPLEPTP